MSNPITKQSYVYVLHAKGTPRVKIGVACDVEKRRRELQTGCPYPLVQLASFPCQRHIEGQLHLHFSKYRKVGEFFELPPFSAKAIMDFIASAEKCSACNMTSLQTAPKKQIGKRRKPWAPDDVRKAYCASDPRLWVLSLHKGGNAYPRVRAELRFVKERVRVNLGLYDPSVHKIGLGRGNGRGAVGRTEAAELRDKAQAVLNSLYNNFTPRL